jgi:hypothetical protein
MKNIFLLFILYISASTSYIKGVSMLPKYSLRNLSLNSNIKLLKSKKTTPLAMIKGSEETDGYLNKQKKSHIVNAIISNINTNYNCTQTISFTGEQINITSIYLNIDKVKGVYFAKDVKNIIFTLPDNLADLYYYDGNNSKDIKLGIIYKISNKTRINMKGLNRFVFQSFNNNIDGILF